MIKPILLTDTISNGFRVKYNETILEIVVSGNDNGDGILNLYKSGGEILKIDLKNSFYQKFDIDEMMAFLAERLDEITQLISDDGTTQIGRGLKYDEIGKITLDLSSTSLVQPTITPTWTILKADNSAYNYDGDNVTNVKSLVIDKGAKVNLSAVFNYPAAGIGQGEPESMTGDFPGSIPAAGVNSQALSVNNILTDSGYGVSIHRPKSGLMVTPDGMIDYASGNSTKSDAINVRFKVRGTILVSDKVSLTSADITAAMDSAPFRDSKSMSFTGVNPGVGQYVYILLDSDLGTIGNVIQDSADSVPDAFFYQSAVNYTNRAGATRSVAPYRTYDTQAFDNAKLDIS